MVTAKFKHLDYGKKNRGKLLGGASITFDGDEEIVDVLNQLFRTRRYDAEWLIDFEVGNFIMPDIRACDSEILDLEEQMLELKRHGKIRRALKIGDAYREYKALHDRLKEAKCRRICLADDKNDVEEAGYNDQTLTGRYLTTLKELGFVTTTTSTTELGAMVEHMESTVSDRSLKKSAKEMLEDLKVSIEDRKTTIAARYGHKYPGPAGSAIDGRLFDE